MVGESEPANYMCNYSAKPIKKDESLAFCSKHTINRGRKVVYNTYRSTVNRSNVHLPEKVEPEAYKFDNMIQ